MKLLCPVCKELLNLEGKSYKCVNRHNFDIAKEGYLNLYLKSSSSSGDEKEMIKGRTNFLNKGHYAFLREEINNIFKRLNIKTLVDLGCGEGYYTSYYEVEDKIGIDLSKEGLKYASKHDKKTTYLLSSIFNTPLSDESTDAVLICFAPVPKEEILRILKKDGYFILIHPNVNHLFELKAKVYDNPYQNEIEEIPVEGLKLIKEYSINNSSVLNNQEVNDLFKMTPYYHTTSQSDKDKLLNVDNLKVSFDFIISIYQK